MNVYLITYILSEIQRKTADYAKIIEDCVIWFVPALNLDGYRKIQEDFQKFGKFNGNIRKNRRPLPQCARFLQNFYVFLRDLLIIIEKSLKFHGISWNFIDVSCNSIEFY